MAWSKTQDNSRRASTGANMSSFVRRIGSLRTTFSKSAALARSHKSSVSPMPQFFSGCKSTESSAAQFLRPETSSIGRWSGRIIQCGTSWENSTQIGAVVSPLTAKHFMQAKSGNQLAAQFGNVTRQRASGADLFTTQTQASRFTSITSHPSRQRNCEQRRRTCCLFASLATNGFIQEGM